jgi:hypothetical protein
MLGIPNQRSIGVWLAVKGFKPSPSTAGMAESEAPASQPKGPGETPRPLRRWRLRDLSVLQVEGQDPPDVGDWLDADLALGALVPA